MKKFFATATIAFLLLTSCSSNENNSNAKSNNKKTLGSSAHDLLSDDKFDSMVVEIVYVQGYEPTAASINNFLSFLDSRIYKSGGITVNKRAIASPGNESYTDAQVIAIEDANRVYYNEGSQIAVWAFFADAKSSKDTSSSVVLGTAYRNTSFVIYENTIMNLSSGINKPSRTVLESTVMQHEFGHILGLTNIGTALQSDHEDPNHKRHCIDSNCLMYWEAESGSNLLGGTIPQLDEDCIADLRENGGK